MNFDYTELIKTTCKDSVCFNYLEHVASYPSGTEKFLLKGVNQIEIFYNESTSEMKLKANFPYYWQGHNFNFSKAQLIEAIQYTSEMLNINVFESEIKSFEYGSIIEIEKQTEDFLFNHISCNGKRMQPYYSNNKLSGKYYEDSILIHKLYDAGRNMKNKLPDAIKADLSTLYGYDKAKHYIKVENHYKKPQIHFKQRNIYLNEVLSDNFMQVCKTDLINSYKSIMKTGIIKLPEDKKDINAGTIPLIVLKELESIFHFNTEELLSNKLKSIPSEMLNKNDKKARQAILKANMKKVVNYGVSEYDISKKLEQQKIY
jgi:hypothetical protein